MQQALRELLTGNLTNRLAGRGNVQEYINYFESHPPLPGLLLENVNFTQADLLTEAIIVGIGRPGLLIQNGRFTAIDPWQHLATHASVLNPCFASVGRIEMEAKGETWPIGTGWVYNNFIITNRHVAELFFEPSPTRLGAFWPKHDLMGLHDLVPRKAYIDFGYEAGQGAKGRFKLKEPVYLPDDTAPDIAILQVELQSIGGRLPVSLSLAATPINANEEVAVVGYPAEEASRVDQILDAQLLAAFFQGQVGVKRIQPGFTTRIDASLIHHDCTTTGGNSGSPLLNVQTGEVVGIHTGGQFMVKNTAVPVAELRRVLTQKNLI